MLYEEMNTMDSAESFNGKILAHPPMRNALISGLLTGIAFGLRHLGYIPPFAEISIYVTAIILGGYHWSREGIDGFLIPSALVGAISTAMAVFFHEISELLAVGNGLRVAKH